MAMTSSESSAQSSAISRWHWWTNEPGHGGTELRWSWGFGLPVFLVLLNGALAWLGRAPGILTRQDDTRYLALADALRQGTYRDVMWPDAPVHHMYPPGYPGLLALWTTVFGPSFTALEVLQVGLVVSAIALLFDAARRVLPPLVSLATLCALIVNPGLLEAAGQVGSESALTFCIAVTIWATVVLPRGRLQVAIAIAAAVAAPLMRAAGVVLPVALAVCLLTERRYRDAGLAAAIGAAVMLPLVWWVSNDPYAVLGYSYVADLVAESPDAISQTSQLLGRLVANTRYYVSRGIPSVLPAPVVENSVIDNVLWIATIIGGLTAGTVVAWRRFRMAMFALLATAGLLLIWTWQVGRYLIPSLLVLYPILYLGLARLGMVRSAVASVLAVALVGGLLTGEGLRRSLSRVRLYATCDRAGPFPDGSCVTEDQHHFFRMAEFVRDSLPRSARVVAAKSEPLYYYTRRLSVPFQRYSALPDSALWLELDRQRARYVLLGHLQSSEGPLLAPLLARRCESLEVVKVVEPRTMLFRIRAGAGAMSSDSLSSDSLSLPLVDDLACRMIVQYLADAKVRGGQ